MNALTGLLLQSSTLSSPALPDAELLTTYQRWLPLEAERLKVQALYKRHRDDDYTEECEALDRRFDAYTDYWHAGMREMMAIGAVTQAGIAAKVHVMKALLQNHSYDGDEALAGASVSEQFAWSLTNDLLRGEPHNPDADLITACNEYLRIDREFAAFCAARTDDELERDEEVVQSMLAPQKALIGRIVAMCATTAQGHLARLRIAAFGLLPNNIECRDVPSGAHVDRLKAATLRDLAQERRTELVDTSSRSSAEPVEMNPDGTWPKSLFPPGQHPTDAPPAETIEPDDCELIELCSEFDALQDRYDRIYDSSQPDFITNDNARSEAAEPLDDAMMEVAERLIDMPAQTPAGILAKLHSYARWDKEIVKPGGGDVGEVLLCGACRDVLRGVGA